MDEEEGNISVFQNKSVFAAIKPEC